MKKAFTLAEVLITLTIIGVIAAITIPNLMQAWKKHEVEVKVKEAYSMLNNVLSIANNGNNNFDDIIGEALNSSSNSTERVRYFTENFLDPNLKATVKCSFGTNKMCQCNRSDTEAKNLNGGSGHTMWPYPCMILNNGMLFSIHPNVYPNGFNIIVDINGNKKPNILGHDIFYYLPISKAF